MKKVFFLSIFFLAFQISRGAERVAINQGFENYTFFTTNLSGAGYTQNSQVEGYWGVFNATQNVTITDTKAYAGTYSLKINRHATTQTNAVGKVYTPLSPTGLNKVEIQAYRPAGSELVMYIKGYNSSNGLTTVGQLSTGDNIGKFFVKNATATNLRTSKIMPADVWVLLRVIFNWTTKKITFEYDLSGTTTSIYELDLTGENIPIDRVELGASATSPSTSGWSIYFDNYKMTEDLASSPTNHFRSKGTGNWSSTSSWQTSWNGSTNWVDATLVPNASAAYITIQNGHNVTLDQDATVSALNISSGGTFTASDATTRILAISKSTSGSSTTLTNSGIWDNGIGGSTVLFTGSPSSGDAVHVIAGTIPFQKLIINKASGSSNVGVDFATNSSVSQSLEIGTGGYVSTVLPSTFYGANAVLKFNQGSGTTYDINATDKIWSTSIVPNSITINSGTVVVQDNRIVSGTMTIDNSAKLILDESKQLTTNILTNNGTLVVKTGATVLTNTVTGTGKSDVQQYLSSTNRHWYLSIPVASASAPANNYVDYYDEETGWVINYTDSLFKGVGYIIKATVDTITFSGSLNNGDQFISLTRKGSNPKEVGFNLVGNPYLSYLNGNVLLKNNSSLVDQTLWYRTYSGSTYAFNTYNAAGDMSVPEAASGGIIPPMQGFWVRVKSGQIVGNMTFSNTLRMHNTTGTAIPLKVPTTNESQKIRLQLFNGTFTDEALVYFNSNAVDGYDSFDSPKMMNNGTTVPNLFTLAGDERLVINGLACVENGREIPLGIQGNAGTYTLSATQFNHLSNGQQVKLIDKFNNVVTDLMQTSYTFTTSEAFNNTTRFSVVLPSYVTTAISSTTEGIFILVSNNKIVIRSETLLEDCSVSVYNLVGQRLFSQSIKGYLTSIGQHIGYGAYVVKVTNGIGNVLTQKVFIK